MEHSDLKQLHYRYASSFFSPNPVIVHAGTHLGEECIDKYSKMFQGSTIFTFEPCLKSYNFSKQRIISEGVRNMHIYNVGLSDTNSVSKLLLSEKSNTHSLFTKNPVDMYTHPQTGETENIQLITLNSWCKENNVTEIDFLSLNIEGNELNALKGAMDILPNTKVIFLEVNHCEIWTGCAMSKDIDDFLVHNNFYLSMHDRRGYYPWTRMQHCAMYVNRKLDSVA